MGDKNRKPTPARTQKIRKSEREISSPLIRLRKGFSLMSFRTQLLAHLIILSAAISLLLFPNTLLISNEVYSLGDVARKDIKAPRDFLVEDEELTKQRRDEASKSSLFVYDLDRSGAYVSERVKESFGYASEELKRIESIALEPTLRSEKLQQLREKFFDLLGINSDPALFDSLLKTEFSPTMENTLLLALNRVFQKGVVRDNTALISQKGKGIVLQDIDTQGELKVEDPDRFYDLEGARHLISQIISQNVQEEISPESVACTAELARLLISPNITFNKHETELQKEEARNSVKPFLTWK